MSGQLPLLQNEPKPFAVFSECEVHPYTPLPTRGIVVCQSESCQGKRYRYLLGWPTGVQNDRICLFVLANPSKASAERTDPTVDRCIKWSREWGYGWCHVVNVRAWRSTDPDNVPEDPWAIGPENDHYIASACIAANLVVCGWGALGGERGPVVERMIRNCGKVPHALTLTKAGEPGHPLYLPRGVRPFALEANR